MSDSNRTTKKIPLSQTKAAVYWRMAMYIMSAFAAASAMSDATSGRYAEALYSAGFGMIFIGLYFRSMEIAAIAYLSTAEEKDDAVVKLRRSEAKRRPWVRFIVRAGWLVLICGLLLEFA